MSKPTFKPSLGLLDATMLVAGSMIGSGIFIVSADITRNAGSAGWIMIVWLIAGIMTMIAAVSYGELSGMFPRAGGQYVYLREAYNPLVGFLYGWSFFAVIQTATIAAVGVAFSKFTAYLFPYFSEDILLPGTGPFDVSRAQLLAIVLIIFLTYINTRGIRSGKIVQNTFTLTKLLSLFGLIIVGLIVANPDIWRQNWENAWTLRHLSRDGVFTEYTMTAAVGAVAAAMVGSIFSNDSWNNITFVAGEIRNPKRNIGLSLLFGTLIVTIVYLLTNIMYMSVLPLAEIASADKDRVAVVASHAIFGNAGTIIIALMIMVATFGCNNGIILAGARVYYTMARDGIFFQNVGVLNRHGVPSRSLWMQCVLACIWCLSGKYGDLLDMISLIVVCFYVLTIAGIFLLRIRRPDLERTYKAFGYPFLPALYILMGLAFCVLLVIFRPKFTWPGLIITLTGIPLYYFFIARNRNRSDNSEPNANSEKE